MTTPRINNKFLNTTAATLISDAGKDERMKNAIRKGVRFITEGRCEILDDNTIRVRSDSGETYTTSLSECTNEGTGEDCPAFRTGFPCKHRAALHILLKIQAEEEKDQQCSDCERRFKMDDLLPVDRTQLEAGSIVPSGECPACGFYCYPIENNVTRYVH